MDVKIKELVSLAHLFQLIVSPASIIILSKQENWGFVRRKFKSPFERATWS
jgi:hypothetical protein